MEHIISILEQIHITICFPSNPTYEHSTRGKMKTIHHPIGEGHFFEVDYQRFEGIKKIIKNIHQESLCGRDQMNIQRDWEAKDTFITNDLKYSYLPVCKTCQEIYKTDPRSPFAKFITGTPLGNKPAKITKPKSVKKKAVKKK